MGGGGIIVSFFLSLSASSELMMQTGAYMNHKKIISAILQITTHGFSSMHVPISLPTPVVTKERHVHRSFSVDHSNSRMKEAAANILYDQLQLTTCLLQLRHLGGSRVYFLSVAVDRHCRFRSARLKKTILKRVSHEVIFSDI